MIRAALLLALTTGPALAEDARPQSLQSLLDYHAAACTAQGGTLTVPKDAIAPARLLGSEDPALILDSSKLSCSTAPAMFCANGIGCELNVFQDDAQHSLIVLSWSLANDEDQDLLVVTISGQLLNKPEPGTYRMTWDPTTKSLVTIPES